MEMKEADKQGDLTYHGPRGKSVVDYVMLNVEPEEMKKFLRNNRIRPPTNCSTNRKKSRRKKNR